MWFLFIQIKMSFSSCDLSTSILWQALSKGVYSNGKHEGCTVGPAAIMEISEDMESQPLVPKSGIAKSNSEEGAGWMMSSFLLINAALGIGLLNIPAAYNQAGGIYFAIGIQIIMVILMLSTMLVLAYCSDVNGDKTYHDVLLSMCGKKAQQLAALSITLTLYCVSVASLIVIGDQLDSLFHTVFGPHFCDRWYLDRRFTIPATSILFILPTCFCKRVDFLRYIGTVGIFAMLYPVFLTVYSYFKLETEPTIKSGPDDIASMFAIMPVIGLGFQCHEVCVPVYSCMRERNLCNFFRSSLLFMGLLFVLYSIIGCFGYLTFGDEIANNIMKMYDASDPFVMVGVGALIVKMIVTYPMLAICGRDAVVGMYAELRGLKPADFLATERPRRYICAAIWFGSSLLLSVLTESIGIVLKYMGSVASANTFIYPGVCLMMVILKKDSEFKSIKSRILVFYGMFIAGFGSFCFGVVLSEAILSKHSEPPIAVCTPTK